MQVVDFIPETEKERRRLKLEKAILKVLEDHRQTQERFACHQRDLDLNAKVDPEVVVTKVQIKREYQRTSREAASEGQGAELTVKYDDKELRAQDEAMGK